MNFFALFYRISWSSAENWSKIVERRRKCTARTASIHFGTIGCSGSSAHRTSGISAFRQAIVLWKSKFCDAIQAGRTRSIDTNQNVSIDDNTARFSGSCIMYVATVCGNGHVERRIWLLVFAEYSTASTGHWQQHGCLSYWRNWIRRTCLSTTNWPQLQLMVLCGQIFWSTNRSALCTIAHTRSNCEYAAWRQFSMFNGFTVGTRQSNHCFNSRDTSTTQ